MPDSPGTGTGTGDGLTRRPIAPAPAIGTAIGTGIGTGTGRTAAVRTALMVTAALLLVAVPPFYLSQFWLRTGFAVCGAAVGAIGLNLLVGVTGQLSLGHAFFVAVGAVSYCYLAGQPVTSSVVPVSGLGLPPVVAAVLAVASAGVAGLLFSPVAARLRGLYLGVASLGLVFVGQHVLNTASPVTGGYNGRTTPPFAVGPFTFADSDPDLVLLGVPLQQAERLWVLGLLVLAGSYWFARNVLNGRPGRAMVLLRESELAAGVMGVHVQWYKALAFLVSSVYAGVAGVLLALSVWSVAPETFGVALSMQYLAMIVLGGLGSVGGSVAGAAFVTALPLALQQYADALPFLSGTTGPGLSPSLAGHFAYGAAVVAVVLFWPEGLAGLTRVVRSRRPPDPGHRPHELAAGPAGTPHATT